MAQPETARYPLGTPPKPSTRGTRNSQSVEIVSPLQITPTRARKKKPTVPTVPEEGTGPVAGPSILFEPLGESSFRLPGDFKTEEEEFELSGSAGADQPREDWLLTPDKSLGDITLEVAPFGNEEERSEDEEFGDRVPSFDRVIAFRRFFTELLEYHERKKEKERIAEILEEERLKAAEAAAAVDDEEFEIPGDLAAAELAAQEEEKSRGRAETRGRKRKSRVSRSKTKPSRSPSPIKSDKMTSLMPNRTAKGAPSFDPKKPEELGRYFADLDENLKRAKLDKDDTECKKYLVWYVPMRVEEEWKNIENYDMLSYADAKAAILNEYPEAQNLTLGSLDRLQQICKENQRIGEADLGALLSFKRAFLVEANKLQAPPTLLANHTLVAAFVKCLTPEFRERVYSKLDISFATGSLFDTWAKDRGVTTTKEAKPSDARMEDRFKLKDIIKVAEEMARIRNPGSNGAVRGDSLVESLAPDVTIKREAVELGPLKQEIEEVRTVMSGMADSWKSQLASMMAKQQEEAATHTKMLLDEMKKSMMGQNAVNAMPPAPRPYIPMQRPFQYAQGTYVPNMPVTPRTCFYCGIAGHMIMDCMSRKAHIEAKKVLTDPLTGKFTYPDGSPINFDGTPRSVREKVDDWQATHPGAAVNYQYYATGSGGPGVIYVQTTAPGAAPRNNRDETIEKLEQEVAQMRQLQQQMMAQAQSQNEAAAEAAREAEKDQYIASLKAELLESQNAGFGTV